MARKIFKRIGIRRDRNLGDLSNTTEALNNLLNSLVDSPRSTFVSEDLDAIRGSFSIGFSNGQYRQIIGSAEFTTNQSGLNSPFLPRITYQNRLDNFEIFAGKPRLFGGNGLTAKYYDSSDINVNSVGIFSGTPFKVDNFWEAGNFSYSGKITPESLNLNGGVEWEGFFIPTVTGTHFFTINSSACFTFDFETQGYVGDPTGTIVPFQRYYNATNAFNFYTTDPSSENLIGYSLQNREAFWAYKTPVSNTLPIYRAANSTGTHLYTISLIEYNGLPVSWTREGIVGYAYGAAPANITNQPIYRASNPTTGDFLYTTSLTEATTTSGYTNQGVAFYSSYPSYTEISRIGISSTLSGTGNAGTNSINLALATNAKYVGIGQTVSGTGVRDGTIVNSVDRSNGVISLTPPSGFADSLTSSGTRNITFAKTVGQNTAISYTPYILIQYRPYRVKFRYFIPQGISAESVSRYINFDLFQPGGNTNGDIRYNYLYSSDYDFSDQALGSFNSFLNNSILSGGGTLGGTTNSDDYVAVETSKKIDIKYQPKTTYAECIKSLVNGSTTSGTPVVSLTNLNTTNIEVGNYVFGTGIPNGSYGIPTTRVNEIIVNNSVILNVNTTVTTTNQPVSFVEHRGLVKVLAGSIFNGVVSLINSPGNTTTGLTKDMIVIGTGLQPYTKITTIQTASSFIVSPSQTTGAVIVLLVYQSKGLINNGLVSYCIPAETKCAIVTNNTPSGSLSLTVNDSTGIGVGWVVQGPQFTSEPATTVTSIPNATTIGISTGTILGFNAGSNFTITSASGDRTICCPPTDTSPPFNPTIDGLDTVPAAPSLRIESGNLRFDSLVGIVSESNITEYSSNDVSGSRISIQTSGGVFGILCV